MTFINDMITIFGKPQRETDVHPHSESEKAYQFNTFDATSTELETLNFLNALIMSYKPKNVIETGTFYGFGTIAIYY